MYSASTHKIILTSCYTGVNEDDAFSVREKIDAGVSGEIMDIINDMVSSGVVFPSPQDLRYDVHRFDDELNQVHVSTTDLEDCTDNFCDMNYVCSLDKSNVPMVQLNEELYDTMKTSFCHDYNLDLLLFEIRELSDDYSHTKVDIVFRIVVGDV